MATSVGALYYDLTVDDSGVDAGLSRADSKMAGFQNKMQKVGEGMSNVGKKMTMGLTLPIVGLGVAGVKMASDLNETINKVNVSFGESAGRVQEWGKTTLKTLGLAKGSALDAAALFGDMATSMGLPQQAAADMSMKMVGLGADLASFKNISFEQAQTALAGVFTGETESLKRLGVVMTQTQLDAFALARGLGKTTSEMTQAELVSLRYAFVMDKTKNAQGDFARTSDGTANQLRIMQETFKETSATIGQNLLPIVTKIAGKVAEWTSRFAELSPKTQKIILIVAGVVAVLGPLLIIVGHMIVAISAISGVIAAMSLTMGLWLLAIVAIAAIAFLVVKNWETLKQWFSTFVGWLVGVWENVKSAMTDTFDKVKKTAEDVIKSITDWFEENETAIKNVAIVITTLLLPTFMKMAVGAGIATARVIANFAVMTASAVASAATTAFVWVTQTLPQMIASFAVMSYHAVINSAKATAAFMVSAVQTLASWAVTFAGMVAGFVVMGVQALISAAKVAASWLLAMGPIGLIIAAVIGLTALIVNNFDWIKEKVKSVWEWIKGNWPLLLAIIAGPIGLAVLTIINNFDRIKAAAQAVWNWINGAFSTIGAIGTSIIKGAVNSLLGFAERTINGFINLINGAIGAINKIPGVSIGAIGTVSVPRLAKGGIASSATAAIFGEAGTEAVLPLSYLNRYSDLFDRIEATSNKMSGDNMASQTPMQIVLNMDGIMSESREGTRGVARTLIGALNEELRAKGKQELAI